MAAEFPLSLVIKAVDKATGPLRAMNSKLHRFTAPFSKLGQSVQALGEESGLSKLGERVGHLGHAFGEAKNEVFELGKRLLEMELIGGFAVFELLKGSVEAGAKLGEMAQRVGLSVDAYAQLQFAAGQAHISQEEFNSAMDKFNVNLGLAKARSGPLYEFLLSKASPALAEQFKNSKDAAAGIELMIKTFEQIKDPARRAALSQEAFGKSGKQWGQFLGQGSAAIDLQRKRYDQLVGSQEAFADQSEAAERALNETSVAFSGVRNAIALGLFPVLTELSTSVADFMAANREGLAAWAREAGKAIGDWVHSGGLKELGKDLIKVGHAVAWVVDKIGGFKGVLIGLAALLVGAPLMAIVNLGLAIWGLVPALATVGLSLYAWTLGPVIASIVTFTQALWAGFTVLEAFQLALAPAVIAAAPFILAAGGIAAAGYEIYKNWGDLKLLWNEFWSGSALEKVQTVWNMVKAIAEAIWSIAKWTPPGMLVQGAQWAYGKLSAPGDQPGRGSLGAAAAAPQQPGGGQKSETKVSVDFSNIPKGVRVSQDTDGNEPIDLSLGYALGLP